MCTLHFLWRVPFIGLVLKSLIDINESHFNMMHHQGRALPIPNLWGVTLWTILPKVGGIDEMKWYKINWRRPLDVVKPKYFLCISWRHWWDERVKGNLTWFNRCDWTRISFDPFEHEFRAFGQPKTTIFLLNIVFLLITRLKF